MEKWKTTWELGLRGLGFPKKRVIGFRVSFPLILTPTFHDARTFSKDNGQPVLLKRTLKVHHSAEKEDRMVPRTFRVVTSEGGFVNDLPGIARTPIALIAAAPKNGMGQSCSWAKRRENASGLDAG